MSQIKDVLLPLATYPDPTPDYVIEQAAELTRLLGARLSVLVSVLGRQKLAKYYSHGAWLMDVPSLIDEVLAKSHAARLHLMETFKQTANAKGVTRDTLEEDSGIFSSSEYLTACARLRDLTFLPIPDFIGLDELQSEDVIFGSGRPVILLPAYEGAKARTPSLDTIVVAWDFSRAAARALGDAIPLLQKAKQVRILLVEGEKDIDSFQTLADVQQHLLMHKISTSVDTIEIDECSIGDIINDYLRQTKADMLVMGAFGHSRLREFVLGGASRAIINKPPLPVFMSH